jgi:hypothetical protein
VISEFIDNHITEFSSDKGSSRQSSVIRFNIRSKMPPHGVLSIIILESVSIWRNCVHLEMTSFVSLQLRVWSGVIISLFVNARHLSSRVSPDQPLPSFCVIKNDQTTLLPDGDAALISSRWRGHHFGAIVLRHAANGHWCSKIRVVGGSQMDYFLSNIYGGLLTWWLLLF